MHSMVAIHRLNLENDIAILEEMWKSEVSSFPVGKNFLYFIWYNAFTVWAKVTQSIYWWIMPLIPNLLVPERSPKYLRGLTRSYQCQFGALPKISLLVMFFLIFSLSTSSAIQVMVYSVNFNHNRLSYVWT